MDVEMTIAHRRAADVVAAFLGTPPVSVRAHLTWGPTLVVEVVVDDELTVFIKAGSNQNVHTEAAVIGRARRAGLPAPEVIGIGTDSALPGQRWVITRAATGVSLEQIGLQAPTTIRTLTDLVPCQATFARLMVSALVMISRSRGWVAACRLRQPM